MDAELTDRQQTILDLIKQFKADKGLPPTVREIAAMAGISAGTVQEHLRALERKGVVQRNSLSTRNLVVLESGREAKRPIERLIEELGEDLEVPILGEIAAGTPILAEENIVGTFSLKNFFFKTKNVFVLRIRGDSMIEDGIFDGDYVFVKQQQTALAGDVVAAMVWGEATVKRYYPEGKTIRLQPANPLHSPIYVTAEDPDFRIIGKVTRVFRELE
jgi:repressor LexA